MAAARKLGSAWDKAWQWEGPDMQGWVQGRWVAQGGGHACLACPPPSLPMAHLSNPWLMLGLEELEGVPTCPCLPSKQA